MVLTLQLQCLLKACHRSQGDLIPTSSAVPRITTSGANRSIPPTASSFHRPRSPGPGPSPPTSVGRYKYRKLRTQTLAGAGEARTDTRERGRRQWPYLTPRDPECSRKGGEDRRSRRSGFWSIPCRTEALPDESPAAALQPSQQRAPGWPLGP